MLLDDDPYLTPNRYAVRSGTFICVNCFYGSYQVYAHLKRLGFLVFRAPSMSSADMPAPTIAPVPEPPDVTSPAPPQSPPRSIRWKLIGMEAEYSTLQAPCCGVCM